MDNFNLSLFNLAINFGIHHSSYNQQDKYKRIISLIEKFQATELTSNWKKSSMEFLLLDGNILTVKFGKTKWVATIKSAFPVKEVAPKIIETIGKRWCYLFNYNSINEGDTVIIRGSEKIYTICSKSEAGFYALAFNKRIFFEEITAVFR